MTETSVALQYPPFLPVAGQRSTRPGETPDVFLYVEPLVGEEVVARYHLRHTRLKFPWGQFLVGLMLWLLPGLAVVAAHLSRPRGHTFLYVTTRRVVVVEVLSGPFHKRQAVISFALEDISGFVLHTQHGIRRLFGILKLEEKHTMYLEIVTRTHANFRLGAIRSRMSRFAPGLDATAMCAELDRHVLATKRLGGER
jgi:hypothetical protein